MAWTMRDEVVENHDRILTLAELDAEGNAATITIWNRKTGEAAVNIGCVLTPADAVMLGRWLLNWGER